LLWEGEGGDGEGAEERRQKIGGIEQKNKATVASNR